MRVGYTGGDVPHAPYRNHSGHAEAFEIISDTSKVTCRDLLEFFFQIHDPTTLNRHGNDIGTSYRSAVFYNRVQDGSLKPRKHGARTYITRAELERCPYIPLGAGGRVPSERTEVASNSNAVPPPPPLPARMH